MEMSPAKEPEKLRPRPVPAKRQSIRQQTATASTKSTMSSVKAKASTAAERISSSVARQSQEEDDATLLAASAVVRPKTRAPTKTAKKADAK